jgi:lysyl-tRNA synthetase class 2
MDPVPPLSVLRARKAVHDEIRRTFDHRGFLEVETPILVPSPGIEPHLEPFVTERVGPDRRRSRCFLHTSPEYAMKRLLARGTGSIYQLARVFRNGEASPRHAPEFTLLEFYRHPGELEQLADDVQVIVQNTAIRLGATPPPVVIHTTMSELFSQAGLPDPLAHQDSTAGWAAALGVDAAPDDEWDDVFHRAWLDRVEPRLDPGALTFVSGYPARLAALAELDPSDPRRAQRMEVFWGDLELGNGYQELSDPVEQAARFEADQRLRTRLGRTPVPTDEALLRDLPGMGRAAGLALGVDRLLMRLLNVADVHQVLPFPNG